MTYRIGLALITGSSFAWSLAGFFTRLIPLDAWTLLAWRGVFAALGIALVDLAMNGPGAWRNLARLGLAGWFYAGLGSVCMIVYITALRHTTVAHVAVIYATVPFFAAVFGRGLLGEIPSMGAVAASLAALVGVFVMVGIGGQGGLLGDALAVGMTAGMALVILIARRFPAIPALTAAAASALLSGLVCLPFAESGIPSGPDLALLALFGLANSAAGLALFTLGARVVPTMETALIGALDAPLAPLWVWLAFAEAPSTGTVLGGLVVFGAVGAHLVWSAVRQTPAASVP